MHRLAGSEGRTGSGWTGSEGATRPGPLMGVTQCMSTHTPESMSGFAQGLLLEEWPTTLPYIAKPHQGATDISMDIFGSEP